MIFKDEEQYTKLDQQYDTQTFLKDNRKFVDVIFIYSLKSPKDILSIHTFLTKKRLDDTFKISHTLQSSIKDLHDRVPNG